jgi:voltage-gated potassium channel
VSEEKTTLKPPPPGAIALSALRIIASATVLVVLYYTLPFDRSALEAIAFLVAGLCGLIALVVYQVRRIGRSEHPGLRAVEGLAISLPLFLLLYAGTYFDLEHLAPGNFSESLSRSDALYLSVSIFSTVGFGDIVAITDGARLLVTCQMLVDLVILGVLARIIVTAVQRALKDRPESGTV